MCILQSGGKKSRTKWKTCCQENWDNYQVFNKMEECFCTKVAVKFALIHICHSDP